MKVEIEIIDRIYHNIEALCKANGSDIIEYITNAVIERYNLDKYGDLNEKFIKKSPIKVTTVKKSKENPISIDSKIDDNKEELKIKVIENDVKETVETPMEEAPKIKKTKRTLKVK